MTIPRFAKNQHMNNKDKAEKLLEDYNDVFADIVNTLLFDGVSVIKEDSLEESKVNSIYKAEDSKLHEQERDISKYWKDGGLNLLIIGIENQTRVDRLMPARIIGYDGASYRSQLLKTDDRGIKARITPVITIVLYFGTRRWNQPKSLKGIVDIPKGLEDYVNDYKINLFEIAYLDREIIDSFKSDFWILADYLYQMRVNKNYVADKKSIAHIEELLMLMSAMTGDKRFEEIIDEANTKEVVNMCEVLDIVEARGIEKGIEKGREKGREEGADIISRLNTILAKEGDLDKIIKANTDKKYRNELLKKYNLLRDYEK